MEIYSKDYYDQADLCLGGSDTLRIMENTVSEIFGDIYNGGAGPCLIAYFEVDGVIKYSSHNSFFHGAYNSSSLHSIEDIFYDKSGGLNFSLIASAIREMHQRSEVSAHLFGQNPQNIRDINKIIQDRLDVDCILEKNLISIIDNRQDIELSIGSTTNTMYSKDENRVSIF